MKTIRGTNQWTISVDDTSLIIKVNQHPNHIILRLGGLSKEVLTDLIDCFSVALRNNKIK